MSFRASTISSDSPHLAAVKKLWRQNSKWLGYLPEGAFVERAEKGCILIAHSDQEPCAGYLIYRVSSDRQVAYIDHLCVNQDFRGQGIARLLVDGLKQRTQELRGIGLFCRRDFPASTLWPDLHFRPIGEKVGRSRDAHPVTHWWYDHGRAHLFSGIEESEQRNKRKAVIDANVFFDLYEGEESLHVESQALQVAWLEDELVLCITNELFIEVNRNESRENRASCIGFARTFHCLAIDDPAVEIIKPHMLSIVGPFASEQDHSDFRQLCQAVAGGADYFVTRDERLLHNRHAIYALCGLDVLRPADLIIHIDELLNAKEYQPVRLAGTRISIAQITPRLEEEVKSRFLAHQRQEPQEEFLRILRAAMAIPKDNKVLVVRNIAGEMMGIMVCALRGGRLLDIPLLRIVAGPLDRTLAECMVLRTLQLFPMVSSGVIRVTDRYMSHQLQDRFATHGFIAAAEAWMKVNLRGVVTGRDAHTALQHLAEETPACAAGLRELENRLETARCSKATTLQGQLLAVERDLWPAKLTELALPVFLVPIQPQWAMHLFDEHLAKQDLFGSDPSLALNGEHVYYRRPHAGNLTAPARILWYVSQKGRYEGTMCVRACSYLDSVAVGSAKEVFRQHRRLGVFSWRDVLHLAHDDPEGKVMAFLFSGTELMQSPIAWNELQVILREEDGHSLPLQSPALISEACFRRLYRLGTSGEEKTE